MSLTKFDNITRSALWTSYNNTCFYCGQFIEWDELHIDHVIPEYRFVDIKTANETIEFYGLDIDFDVNSLLNLVPAHSKCNLKKGGNLMKKQTTLFYLELVHNNLNKVKIEIDKIKRRKNRGLALSKLYNAFASDLINKKDLKKLIAISEKHDWDNKEIKIPLAINFIDEIYDSFYFNSDYSALYDKTLLIGGVYDSLEIENDEGQIRQVSTLRQWTQALAEGFNPMTNFSIKLSSAFTHLEEIIDALQKAKIPRISFISEPWLELGQLDYLSPSVIIDFEGKLDSYIKDGVSVGELVRRKIISINESGNYKISLELDGFETSLIEQFRADFNNDGIEDMFVQGWTRATGGTMGFGFTTILTRYSNSHLLEKVKQA